MSEFEGASLRERLIEAVRRNNLPLFQELLDEASVVESPTDDHRARRRSSIYGYDDDQAQDPTDIDSELGDLSPKEAAVAEVLNSTRTILGNTLYHEAAQYGSYDIMDCILDQAGVECDPTHPQTGDTPLHTAVQWVNRQTADFHTFGKHLIALMVEAGSDPRIRNLARLRPAQLVSRENEELREYLEEQEYVFDNEGDFVRDTERLIQEREAQAHPSDSESE